MVEYSKLYRAPLNYTLCATIIHPGMSCAKFSLFNLWGLFRNTSKYYLPILIVQLPLRWKQLNMSVFYDTLNLYASAVAYTTGSVSFSLTLICILRLIYGKMMPVFIPICTGMQLAWLFPERLLRLFSLYTLQMTLDVMLRKNAQRFLICRLMLHSMPFKTLLFMLSSAIILHFKKIGIYHGFWFIKPITNTAATDEHWFQRFVTHLKSSLCYGLAIELFRALIKTDRTLKTGKSSVAQWVMGKIKGLRFSIIGFFVIYESLYHFTQWLWSKYDVECASDKEIQHFVAAFLGGISYMRLNNNMLLLYAMLTSIQLLLSQLRKYVHNTKRHWLLTRLIDLPFTRLLIPWELAYMTEACLHEYDSMSNLSKMFLKTFSNNLISDFNTRINAISANELLHANLKAKRRGFFN